MHEALERGAPDVLKAAHASRALNLVRVPQVAALGALTAAAVFEGGGSSERSLVWIGTAALLLAAGSVAAGLTGVLPLPRIDRLGAWSLALFGTFVLWQGASVLWSIAPDRSWDYFNRGLVYFAFAVAGAFAGALCGRRQAAGALALVIAGVLVVALAGKMSPDLYPDGARIARLRSPIGFWNALALLFAIGMPLALWLAGELRRPAYRALAGVFLYGLMVGLLLTYSRSGILASLLAVGAWLAFGSARVESGVVALLAAVGAAVVGIWAFGQPGVADDMQAHATRVTDGWQLGVMLLVGGLAVWTATYWVLRSARLPKQWRLPEITRRQASALAVGVLVLLAAAAVASAGWIAGRVDEFANPSTDLLTQDPSRLGSVSSNNRWDWWREAWTAFREAPLEGTGAGSFETTHRLLRDDPLTVTEPHSLPLQFLSETGLVGGVLAGGAAVLGLLAVGAAVRRAGVGERAATLALGIGVIVFAAHSLVDWDWDFLALGGPIFATFGLLLADGRSPARARRPAWAVAPVVVALAAVSSLALPWAADRETASAHSALAAGSPRDALASAETAAALNPTSVDPLFAQALASTALGNVPAARRSLRDAVELQPANAEAWHELGLFELDVARERDLALEALERAYALDPFGPAGPSLARMRESRG